MSEPQRYLTRVFIFLGVVAVVVLALIQPISRAFMVNPGLNGLIVGTLLVGILYTIRQIVALKRERRWIEEFRRADSVTGITERPVLLAPMATMLGENRTVSLSTLSMRTILDAIGSRLEESREITRYAVGLLIFLGLLGTFWGLVTTIGAIGDTIRNLTITSSDPSLMFESLKSGIEAPLAGMGTAFTSSLFGLSGSLILGFIDLQAGQAQNRFYHDLEDWLSTVTKLGSGSSVGFSEGEQAVPAYVAALLEQTAESLDSLQRTVSRAEESRQAERDLLARLVEGQNRPATAPLIDDETRALFRSLDNNVKRLADDAGRGREQLVDEIRSEIKLLARTIGAAAAGTTAATIKNKPSLTATRTDDTP